MKTLHQKVKELLELNTLKGVALEHKDGRYIVARYMLGDGDFIGSLATNSIENCLDEGCTSSWSERYVNENFTNKITPIPHKPKSIEVGTKVSILEIAKDIKGLCFKAKEMIGEHGLEVRGTYDDEYGISYRIKNKVGNYADRFPAYCVVPTELINQEVETDAMQEAMELLKEKGYKIIKE